MPRSRALTRSFLFLLSSSLCASLTLLACQNTNNVNVNIPVGSSGAGSQSVFKALGGAGLDPTVIKHCGGDKIDGDQGYARATAKEYRQMAENLLRLTAGGANGNTGSVYGVDNPFPTAEPTSEPTAEPTAAPTAEPLPSATSDISVVEKTGFNGKVFDITGAPLDGVTVTVRSLNSSVPYEATTTTASGTYAFNNAPSGVQVEIIVTRPGYGTRRRVEVLKSNKNGDPNANKYDFGSDGTGGTGNEINGLSDEPEVISILPGRNASGVATNTPVTLTFSEPMDRNSVESNFAICKRNALDELVPVFYGNDFQVSWNSDDTEVSFTFKNDGSNKRFDTDIRYEISFKAADGQIRDKAGITRDSNYFKLTDGGFEQFSRFTTSEFITQFLLAQDMPNPEATPLPPFEKERDSFFFSYDDSASVASVELFKQALNNGRVPDKSLAQPWEFLNYENFDHIAQQDIGTFEVSMGLWKYPSLDNRFVDHYEVGVHLTAPYKCQATRPNLNLTVVIDVSTSMEEDAFIGSGREDLGQNKLELVKFGLKEMARQLKDGDVINIVLFSNKAFSELERFRVGQDVEADYLEAIERIEPLGGTNIQAALDHGYRVAEKHFDEGKMNRLLLLTDAHPTEGSADTDLISSKARNGNDNGIFISALGMGYTHNFKLLNEITEAGRGAYYSVTNKTDMREAMGDRFLPLIDVVARDVRFKLEFPGWMRHGKTAAEQISADPSEVQATNFSANTSQYFWEQFRANKGDFNGSELVKLTISYRDPKTLQDKVESYEKTVAEILDKDLSNIKTAHLIQLNTALVLGEMRADEARQELAQLIPEIGS